MNQRDLERGALSLMVIVGFVGGLLMSGTLFAHKNAQTQMTPHDAASVVSLLSESPPTR